MFGISFEHILILGVILLIMGPKRLPELGKSLGMSIKNFKDSLNGLDDVKKLSDQKADEAKKDSDKNT